MAHVITTNLSSGRAQAVVDYLVPTGVDPRRSTARGNGHSKLLASDKTSDGRASHQRTDLLSINSGNQL